MPEAIEDRRAVKVTFEVQATVPQGMEAIAEDRIRDELSRLVLTAPDEIEFFWEWGNPQNVEHDDWVALEEEDEES